MASIGIIANPASGKDIRRLVSYATVFDNNEKLNIVKRIVLAAQSMGVTDVYFMPDTFQMGYKVMDELTCEGVLRARCHILEIPCSASLQDSVESAREMEALHVGCVVVLGGDGTSRAAAKGVVDTPLLAISTGTNNVYPVLIEGTVAGMAAAAIAVSKDPYTTCVRDKRIEVWREDRLAEIALIDAVVSSEVFVGAKAIWNMENIRRIYVTRCHPAAIGFSSIAGTLDIVRPGDDGGFFVEIGDGGQKVLAPVAAGKMQMIPVKESGKMAMDEDYPYTADSRCVIALDGEREIVLKPGDRVDIRVTRKGPWRVDIKATLEEYQKRGGFLFAESATSKEE